MTNLFSMRCYPDLLSETLGEKIIYTYITLFFNGSFAIWI